MIKFKSGDPVIKIEDNKIRKGVIRRMFFDVEPVIALVDFDEGTCEKVYITDLALVPETPETEPVAEATEEATEKEETEPIRKTEVTITYDEFVILASKTAIKASKGDFTLGLALSMFAGCLAEELFKVDPGND